MVQDCTWNTLWRKLRDVNFLSKGLHFKGKMTWHSGKVHKYSGKKESNMKSFSLGGGNTVYLTMKRKKAAPPFYNSEDTHLNQSHSWCNTAEITWGIKLDHKSQYHSLLWWWWLIYSRLKTRGYKNKFMATVCIIINFLHSESTVIWKKKKKTFLEVPYLMDHCCTVVPACIQHLHSKRAEFLCSGKGWFHQS